MRFDEKYILARGLLFYPASVKFTRHDFLPKADDTMRSMKLLMASLFLAAVIAVPVYAHISFNAPQTYAQCDGHCESCPNTGCPNNPNHKPDSSKSDKSGSDANKSGADKAAPDKGKDQAPAKK